MKSNLKGMSIMVLAGLLSLTGCNMYMSASERVGIEESEEGLTEADVQMLPVLTVRYEPYDLYEQAKYLFDMEPDEVDADENSKYGNVNVTPVNEEFTLGNTGIWVYTDGFGMSVRWTDDAQNYESVFNNALIQARREKNTYINSDYILEPSHLAIGFPMDQTMEDSLEDAADEVSEELEKMGLSPDVWYGGMTDASFWKWYYDAGHYKRDGFEPEDNICFFSFRQSVDGVTIENIEGENAVYVVYSMKEKEMLLLNTNAPCYGEIISREQKNVIPESEILILAKDILKKRYSIPNPVTVEAELVYATKMIGQFNMSDQTTTLYPTWKVSYEELVNDTVIHDYILLNAETGVLYANQTPLY